MSVQLRKKETLGRGLRRACGRHIRKALSNMNEKDQSDAVHDARKEIKKLRALFRLMRSGLQKKEYRKIAATMRLAGKPLGSVRDARVTEKALADLTKGNRGSDAKFFRLKDTLSRFTRHAERGFQAQDSGALAKYILENVCGSFKKLHPRDISWSDLEPCLKKSYAEGRDAYQLAMLQPKPEHLHEWRKRVKDLWYQLDFLCSEWPPKTKAMLHSLEKLGEHLGDDHDLVLLSQFSQEQGDGAEDSALQPLISSKRKHYEESVRRLGSTLFAQLPDSVCEQWKRDWKTWRKA